MGMSSSSGAGSGSFFLGGSGFFSSFFFSSFLAASFAGAGPAPPTDTLESPLLIT